ncbi:trypsin-like peptidase domain-containing protein [Mesorhizobium amorphae]|uniref:trypsin-like peptidase domain-containing protein n=1 Tax=Mesorhizobium amorphae TaxID=71433 RepID=UPI003ED13359
MNSILLIYPRQGGRQPANAIADDIRRRDEHFVWPIDSVSAVEREFRMGTASCIIFLAIPGWRSDGEMIDQLAAAERLGKDMIVVTYDEEPDLPRALESAPRVSMSAAGGTGLDALHEQIVTELSDLGRLQRTQHRLQEARAALADAKPYEAAYLKELISEFEKSATQIGEQLADLPAAQRRHAAAKKEIRDRRRESRSRRVAARPPVVPPARMIGREKEIAALRSFLDDPGKSIALISGASGAGKTALAAYVLADTSEVEHPDRKVVYGRFDVTPPSEFADVYEDLAIVAGLDVEVTGAASVQLLIASLLNAFTEHPEEPYPVLLVDGVDGTEWSLAGQRGIDRELIEFLRAAAGKRQHGLKIIVTTTGLSNEIEQLARSDRVSHLRLDKGLDREQALDLMTKGDLVPLQLRNLSEPQIDTLMAATSGMPQALVTVRAALACSGGTIEDALPGDHLSALVNEMLERLSRTDRSILEALAIFGMPVGKTAIDDVIIAVDGFIDSASSLDWLTRRSIIVRNDVLPEPLYDLHSALRHEVIRVLQQTEKGLAPFGIFSRLRRLRRAAARYLRGLEQPLSSCRDIDDIWHYRARFALYLQLEEFKKASSILKALEPFLRDRGAYLVLLQLASSLANSSQAPPRIKTAARRIEAYALWALGRPREALRWQDTVLTVPPSREDLLAKGRYLRTLGRFEDASKILCQALEVEAPDRNDSLEAEVWCERARCSERQGFLNDALDHFDRAIQLSGERPERRSEYLRGKADVHLSWIQPEQARSDLELAADCAPSGGRGSLLAQADTLSLKGRVEFLFGDYQVAERMLQEAVKLRRICGPQPVLEACFTRLGRLHMLLGRLDLAADLVRQATYWLELRNGSDYQATILAAQIGAQQDDWKSVEGSLSPIVGLLPEHGVMVRSNLMGLANLGLGRPKWAADRFRTALQNSEEWLERCATNPEVIRQRAVALSGLAAAENRPQADAVAAFEDLCTITRFPGAVLWNCWWAKRLQSVAGAYEEIDCIVAAAEGRIDPKEQSRLKRIEAEIGKAGLEKITNPDRPFVPVREFARRVDQAISATCAIQDNGQGIGTGFLIGPDLVLTNFHVVEEYLSPSIQLAKGLVCRFDYLVLDGVPQPGIGVGLAPKWCVAQSRYSKADLSNGASAWGTDELDYAVLVLERPFGKEPGPDDDEPRGWIDLGRLGKIAKAADPVYVVQHSQRVRSDDTIGPQQRMEMTDGEILSLEGEGMRLRHSANTYKGASGSMCLDVRFHPIGLHHAGQPDDERPTDWPAYRGEYNQAVPLHLIAEDLLQRQVMEEDDDGRLLPGPLARSAS